MLHIHGLSRPGLQRVDLDVDAGTCIAIRGSSGAGKSLLLRAIADLDPADGEVSLKGMSRTLMSAPTWRKRVIYVAAESGWWDITVGDHFSNPDIAAGYLVRLGFTDDAMSWPVSRLSTGERQRLALLRAIVLTPEVMLLDEPTSALDPEATAKVESILHEKRAAGTAIIMVTHDKAQAARMAEHRFVMTAGALSAEAAS
jgi:ABC-type iron transport system FetAB ATPase subunit